MSEQQTIYPTKTCFDDAIDILCEMLKAHPDAAHTDEFLLVHAICNPPSFGRMSHAWVENSNGKGVAFFKGIIKGETVTLVEPVDEHYKRLKVEDLTKYTPAQVWTANCLHRTYGPWEKKYLDLCNDRSSNVLKQRGSRGS